MTIVNLEQSTVSQLAEQAEAIGKLAQDEGAFAATVAAFESNDPNAFRWVLQRLELLPRCELICEWIRVKWCVLRCIEVCGPPDSKVPVPELPDFARALVRLAENEAILRRVVDAVTCGDADAYRAAIGEARLQAYCHLICRYVCSTVYRRICEVVCTSRPILTATDSVLDIRADAETLKKVIANKTLMSEIGKAALALDCEPLQTAINAAGFTGYCEIICRLICVRRCVWTCSLLCERPVPILTGAAAIEEARAFALATRQLAAQPRALADLVAATVAGNVEGYSAIVDRFGLAEYCWQLCSWVCSEVCYGFCICVCPPPGVQPWFTSVGDFDIYTQIDPTTGRTSTAVPATISMPWGGGPNFAFNLELQLGGYCPSTSPISPGVQMQYRFYYANAKTTLASPISTAQTAITVAAGAVTPATPFDVFVCDCATGETGETMTVSGVSGVTWTVARGQQGTAAAAAVAGATLFIDPKPITGPLVDTPVLVGYRFISWPGQSGGLATSTLVSTQEPIYVGYGTDTPQPASGATYKGPTHYIPPDPATGWVQVDTSVIGGAFNGALLNFDTTKVVAGGCPLPGCVGTPGGAPAGSPVPAANQGAGTELSIIFQAVRVGTTGVDSSNSLCTILVNNWTEVTNLWFTEFGAGSCCTPIDTTLSVQFTADHEEMESGGWSLVIVGCSPSAPGNITPTASGPGVTVSARGGYGTIVEDTGGLETTLAAAVSTSTTTFSVATIAGVPTTPFNAYICSTGEAVQVSSVAGDSWTVVRGQNGTTPANAAAGTEIITSWCDCSYTVWLSTRAGLTTGLYDNRGQSIPLTFCICSH